jgi:rare lipoprotein A
MRKVILLSLLVVGCAHAAPPHGEHALAGWTQRGKATWYGGELQGSMCASGERFDENKLTAAHRTLPLGARVLVTNLKNGRTVEVRINDRGPYGKGRIIDLSRAAARKIDMLAAGVAEVELRVLSVPPPRKRRRRH